MRKRLIIALIISLLVSVSACSDSRKTETPETHISLENNAGEQNNGEKAHVSGHSEKSTVDPQNKFKLPAKVTVCEDHDGDEYVETITLDFNANGDIIRISDHSGTAETIYWDGTGKKKEVVWTGTGYNSVETLYYDKEGHLKNIVDDWGDLDTVLTYDFEYQNGWISKETDHYVNGTSEKEYDLTFHDSGMIKSMGNTLYNDCGLIEHQETGGQYPCTYAVEYEKDDDGNVISALIEITNIHDGSISQKSVVFEYTEDYRVSQRTHSAWICYCLSLPGIEALKPYSDILGIFY